MKILPWVLLVVLLAFGGWQYVERVKSRQAVAGLEVQRDSLLKEALEGKSRSALLEARLDTIKVRADSTINEAARRERNALVRARTLGDSIRAALEGNTAIQAMFDSLTVAYEVTIESLRDQVSELWEVREAQDELIEEQKQTIISWEAAFEAEQALTRHWEREANPPFLVGLWQDLPKLVTSTAVGVGIGYILANR